MNPYKTLTAVLAGFLYMSSGYAHAQGATQLPTVVVLSTGGTIAGKGAATTALSEYKAGSILGEQLVAAVPEIKQYANVRVEQVVNVGSPNVTLENWLTIANRINAIFATDAAVSGVVIWHQHAGRNGVFSQPHGEARSACRPRGLATSGDCDQRRRTPESP
jgi:L-asparaginase